MTKPTAKIEDAGPSAPVDVDEVLRPLAGKTISGKDLGAKLRAAGHKDLKALVAGMLATGDLKWLGNVDDAGGFRYVVLGVNGADVEAWVRAQHGPAVEVESLGRFDQLGRAITVSAKVLAYLKSRNVPVEVITDSAKVTKLKADAKERKAAASVKRDVMAEAMTELG